MSEMWLKEKNHPSIITSVPDHDRTTEQSHIYKTVMWTHTTMLNILRTLTTYLREEYTHIPVDSESISELTRHIMNKLRDEANKALGAPISTEELKLAVKTGKPHKAPGRDGISFDYFKIMWNVTKTDMLRVMNEMFRESRMTDAQKHGLLVCVPKSSHPR